MVRKKPNQSKKKTTVAELSIVEEKQSASTVVKTTEGDESLLGMGESFSYKSVTVKHRTTTGVPAVEPFPKTTVIKVMQVMFEKKQSRSDIRALAKRESRILSGMLVGEFINCLNQIIPDAYNPKGRNKKNLKLEKPNDWKKEALNEPSIRDKLKRFVGDGDLIVFKVDKGRYMYCLTKTFMDIKKYVGSIWHLLQVRHVLFQSSQWPDTSQKKGMRNWFIPNPFFDTPLKDLESLLTLSEANIWKTWDKEEMSFNLDTIKKVIEPKVDSG